MMMKKIFNPRRLQILALAGGLFAVVSVWAFDAFAQGKGKKVNAAAVYAANCARCHGADGKGTALGQSLETPDLTSVEVQNNMSNAKIRRVILNGDGPMPGFKSKLTAAQVTALTSYVRAFKGR
jgi:mono/diheme cytochrome c family protein